MDILKDKKGVYLINNISSDKNLHKVGCSKFLYQRIINGYINPNILIIGFCENYKELEKIIIKEFKLKFGNPAIKKEYFNCNEK